jgi:hypothetical protein
LPITIPGARHGQRLESQQQIYEINNMKSRLFRAVGVDWERRSSKTAQSAISV